MGQLKVRNWEEWQTYRKDRPAPPWIKIHRRLLLDPDFITLSDSERSHILLIWVAAASKNGVINDDPKVVQRLINSDVPPDLEKFLSLQLLEKVRKRGRQKDAKKTSQRRQNVTPEERGKKKEEETLNPLAGFEAFWSAYSKKNSKGQAQKAWVKLSPDDDLQNRIMTALENAKRSEQWLTQGGRFIPYPATWLNARGWEDELPTQKCAKTLFPGFDDWGQQA